MRYVVQTKELPELTGDMIGGGKSNDGGSLLATLPRALWSWVETRCVVFVDEMKKSRQGPGEAAFPDQNRRDVAGRARFALPFGALAAPSNL